MSDYNKKKQLKIHFTNTARFGAPLKFRGSDVAPCRL